MAFPRRHLATKVIRFDCEIAEFVEVADAIAEGASTSTTLASRCRNHWIGVALLEGNQRSDRRLYG